MRQATPQPRRSVSRFAVAAALALFLAGGQLGLLQVVAWAGMVVNYSGRYGLTEGVTRTFDGKNPCPMCKKIEQARKTQKENKPSLATSSSELICLQPALAKLPAVARQNDRHDYPAFFARVNPRTDRPATPPPRTTAA